MANLSQRPVEKKRAVFPTTLPTPRLRDGWAWVRMGGWYLILGSLALLTIMPFMWLVMTSLKSSSEAIFSNPPHVIPAQPTLDNYIEIWGLIPLKQYYVNSILVSLSTVILNLLTASLAAYPLAKMRFRGRTVIFYLILSTIIVPEQLTMIPLYVLMVKTLGLANTLQSLVWPFATSAFGIFLLRQSYLTISDELLDAAVIDGASHIQIWWLILLPLTRPALATLAIFTFVGAWDRFLWPLLMLKDQELYTLPVGLVALQGLFNANWRSIAAGTVSATVPIILFFLFFQRYFFRNMSGAIKG